MSGRAEPMGQQKGSQILVADDEPHVRAALARILTGRGHQVTLAGSVTEARAFLAAHPFDVVLTDVHMPGESGIDLLRYVRSVDQELPVVLITGAPTTESAVHAVQLNATGYLTKPIDPDRLLSEVSRVITMRELAEVRRRAHEVTRREDAESDLSHRFESALSGLYMVFHPVVHWSEREVFGFEALMRTTERSLGNPLELLHVAERLGRVHELGRTVRRLCALAAAEAPESTVLLVNLHPFDLTDPELLAKSSPLSRLAERVVIEITERAQLESVPDAESRIAALREIGFRVAIDDIGAGYSGLNTFALLRPDFVKVDMALVRQIDQSPVKRRLTTLLVQLCTDLGIGVIAEGVETAQERDTLLEIGCDLLQGYLFARPAAPMPAPTWDA
jgi:EAL domain-containing protein (putative c-di-GMP-specific phosphodiesterase class I)